MKKMFRFAERYWLLLSILAGGLVFGGVMLLAVGQSIWFDEGYSILLARESYGELFALTAVDAHPPLYYILLKTWADLFGFQEFTLRALSALLAGGTVTVALLLTKRLFGVRTALVTLPILALAPFFLRYGYEVRMYALATFIGVAATYALVRAREIKRFSWWWVAYAVLVALGMYTLYLMAAVWIAHVVWLAWSSIKAGQKFTQWKWFYVYAGAIALYVPYLPTFFYQLTNSALPGMGNELTFAVIGDILTVLFAFTPEWMSGGWLTILIIATLSTVAVLGVRVWKSERKLRGSLALYIFLATVPLLFFGLSSLPPRDPIFVVRYVAHVSVWIYLLIGVIIGLSWQRKKGGRNLVMIASALYAVLAIIGVWNVAERGNYIFERVQTPMTQELRASVECSEDTVIIADDPYTYIDSVFYFEGCDMRFYAENSVEKKGGYAMLHDSTKRVSSDDALHAKRVVHLHWGEPAMEIGEEYELRNSRAYGKQHLNIYEAISE